MSESQDTWKEIQAHKSKQLSLREKLARRKRAREEVVAGIIGEASPGPGATGVAGSTDTKVVVKPDPDGPPDIKPNVDIYGSATSHTSSKILDIKPDIKPDIKVPVVPETPLEALSEEEVAAVEKELLLVLDDVSLNLPTELEVLRTEVCKAWGKDVPASVVENLLQKFAAQMLVSVVTKESEMTRNMTMVVESVDHKKVSAVSAALGGTSDTTSGNLSRKRKRDGASSDGEDMSGSKDPKLTGSDEKNPDESIESLLLMQSAKERESKRLNEEIVHLLSQPTAKEQSLVEKFKSQGGAQVKEFCQYGTTDECNRISGQNTHCDKLHFKKIIHKHTDESLGDCSFLNTCFHMDTCKYVHYEIAYPDMAPKPRADLTVSKKTEGSTILYPPQWIMCDLRHFDMSVLGKFAVIMADPPWDIHMELPYGTMQDNEMRNLNVPVLQDDGYIFLWVTGRAMELGRECLSLWGYERVDELIWVKANQLQRIIRTGRTGHWLNHGKEHCLIGMKGKLANMNRGLDCDVIVAEVRATSHKPDEVYGIIERLSPGTRKIELFGRPHNVQPNWITLGNQVDGVKLIDPDVVRAFKKKYPDGNCMQKAKTGPNS